MHVTLTRGTAAGLAAALHAYLPKPPDRPSTPVLEELDALFDELTVHVGAFTDHQGRTWIRVAGTTFTLHDHLDDPNDLGLTLRQIEAVYGPLRDLRAHP